MRGHTILLIALLALLGLRPDSANAQFSPQGILGAVTRPFRHMLGSFGHFPRHRAIPGAHDGEASPAPNQAPVQFPEIGPPAWPTAFEDILGYTFWPATYAAQVRGHGFDVIADAVTGAPRGTETARAATTGAAVQSDSDSKTACDTGPEVQIEWPISQVEQMTQLNDTQRDALGKLRTALAESMKAAKAGCGDIASLPKRLDATVQQLWALRDAGIYIRTSLKDFYDSLTDAQKASFQWKQPQDYSRQGAQTANGGMGKQYQACAQLSLQGSERLIKQIEQEIRPSKEQSPGMDALRKTTSDMSKLLTASCAHPIPFDPVARLDSADDQLSTMSYAATSVEIALDGLYGQLDERQKAKFNSFGH